MDTINKWVFPKPTTDVQMAFGSIEGLLPPQSEIPEEFQSFNNPWCELVSTLFYRGGRLPEFKDGINPDDARRQISACLSSWEPKHEHKTSGVAYLLSLWCVSPEQPE